MAPVHNILDPTLEDPEPSIQPPISSNEQLAVDQVIQGLVTGGVTPASGTQTIPGAFQQPQQQQIPPRSAVDAILMNLGQGGQPDPERPGALIGEFVKGVKSGIHETVTMFRGAQAVISDVAGADQTTDELIELIQERGRTAERDYPRTVAKVEDIDSIGNFVRFASRALGEQVPVLASIIAGGGVGGVLGRLVAKKAITRGVAAQVAARYPIRSAGAAAVATATGIETGATAEEQIGAKGKISPGVAIAAGVLKGSLEALVPATIGARFGITPNLSRGLIGKLASTFDKVIPRRLAAIPAYATAEGLTELMQESVDLAAREFIDENYDALGEEGRSRLLNAAVTGALVGGIIGPVFGGSQRQSREAETVDLRQMAVDEGLVDDDGGVSSTDTAEVESTISEPPTSEEEFLAQETDEVIAQQETDAADQAGLIDFVEETEENGLIEVGDVMDTALPPGPGITPEVLPEEAPIAIESGPEPFGDLGDTSYSSTINDLVSRRFQSMGRDGELLTTPSAQTYEPSQPGERRVKLMFQLREDEAGVPQPTYPRQSAKYAPNQDFANRIADFYEDMIKELNIDTDIILAFGPDSDLVPGSSGWTASMLAPNDKGGMSNLDIVLLSTEKINQIPGMPDQITDRPFENVVLTAIHEFGHILMTSKFGKLPQAMKEMLLNAYNRETLKAKSGYDVYLQRFAGPLRASILESSRVADDMSDTDMFSSLKAEAGYWFGFDEWMAEQLVRAQTIKRTRLDAVGNHFRQLAGLIQKLIQSGLKRLGTFDGAPENAKQRFNSRLRKFAATREFADFLEHSKTGMVAKKKARAKGGKKQVLSLKDFYQQSQKESSAKNLETLKRMGIAGREGAAPEQAAVQPTRILLNKLLPSAKADEITAVADNFTWFSKLFESMQQIGQKNPHIKQLQSYVELVDRWYNFTMHWVSNANDILRQWMSLGRVQNAKLANLIFDYSNMEFLTVGDLEPRLPTETELAALAQKHGVNEAGMRVFERQRIIFNKMFNQIELTATRDAQRAIRDPNKLAAKLAEIREEFARLRGRPYFPHARFGDIAVIVKDIGGQTVYLEQFESHKQAKAQIRNIAREHPEGTAIIREIPKNVQVFHGLPGTVLEIIRDNLDPHLLDEQKGWLDDFISEIAATTGLRKKLAKKRNIEGYSRDAMRTFANYFFHTSKQLARLEFGSLMELEIRQLTEENAQAAHMTDVVKRDRIKNYMINHYDYIMNPKPDWAQLRSAAFIYHLGFSPASAAINLTQIPIVAWPYLSARFGDGKAANALRKAATSLPKYYNAKQGNIPQDLFDALEQGVEEGVIDESQATELAGLSQGSYVSRLLPGSKGQQNFMQFATWASWMFQSSEKINRRVVFRAAWDLAKNSETDTKITAKKKKKQDEYVDSLITRNPHLYKELQIKGWSPANARAYLVARDATRATQFHYAAHARPEFMQGKKGVLFTFFQFTQNMLWFAKNQPGNTRMLLMLFVAGGLMGLPGAEDLIAFAKFAGRKLFGKDYDPERELRKFVVDLTEGTEIPPDLILLGTGRYGFGLPAVMDMIGLPKATIDLSGNVSMGRVIPGLAELGNFSSGNFDERFARIGTDVAGASFGIGINVMKALADSQYPIDDFKRWERAMPRAMRNLVKAGRFYDEERERTRSGGTVIDFDLSDPNHLAEIVAQGLGFAPTRLSQRWDREAMARETEQFWMVSRQMLMTRFDQSIYLRDTQMQRDTLGDIQDYNKRVPFRPMAITAKDVKRSRKERVRNRRLFEAGIAPQKSLRALRQETDRLFPEVGGPEEDVQDVSRIR